MNLSVKIIQAHEKLFALVAIMAMAGRGQFLSLIFARARLEGTKNEKEIISYVLDTSRFLLLRR